MWENQPQIVTRVCQKAIFKHDLVEGAQWQRTRPDIAGDDLEWRTGLPFAGISKQKSILVYMENT